MKALGSPAVRRLLARGVMLGGSLTLLGLLSLRLYEVSTAQDWRGDAHGDSRGERTWFAWAWGDEAWRAESWRAESWRDSVSNSTVEKEHLLRLAEEGRLDWVKVMSAYRHPGSAIDWSDDGTDVKISQRAEVASSWTGWRLLLGGLLWLSSVSVVVWFFARLIGFSLLPHQPLWVIASMAFLSAASLVLVAGRVLLALGVWLGPWTWLLMALVLGFVWRTAHRLGGEPVGSDSGMASTGTELRGRGGRSDVEGSAVAGGAGLTIVAGIAFKLREAPLWSWDHFAIWGVKARQLAVAGADAPFLDGTMTWSNPQYPLGLPALWATLSPGPSLPAEWLFDFWHVALTVLVVAMVIAWGRAIRVGDRWLGLVVLWLGLTPLIWDTEQVGLAETSLAAWMLAALLCWRLGGRHRWTGLAAFAGVLVFLKDEGTPLAVILFATAFVLDWIRGGRSEPPRWADLRRGLAVLVTLMVVGRGVCALQPSGVSFLAGDFLGRLKTRLTSPSDVLGPVFGALSESEWLGLWWLIVPLGVASIVFRRWMACALLVAALTQLGVYVAVYFVSYLEPSAHIVSSFRRVAAVLSPLVMVAVLELLAEARSTTQPDEA